MKNWSHLTFLFGFLMLVTSCHAQKDAKEDKVVPLSPRDFQSRLASTPDAVVLDVRTPQEYSEGIIEGAINVDFRDPSFSKKIEGLDKTKPYFVYCLAGKRSDNAAKQMESAGFKNVFTLTGGYEDWNNEGLKTVKPK